MFVSPIQWCYCLIEAHISNQLIVMSKWKQMVMEPVINNNVNYHWKWAAIIIWNHVARFENQTYHDTYIRNSFGFNHFHSQSFIHTNNSITFVQNEWMNESVDARIDGIDDEKKNWIERRKQRIKSRNNGGETNNGNGITANDKRTKI